MPDLSPSPRVLTLSEACAELRISYRRGLALVHNGELQAKRVGRHWRIRSTELDRYLDDRSEGQAPA